MQVSSLVLALLMMASPVATQAERLPLTLAGVQAEDTDGLRRFALRLARKLRHRHQVRMTYDAEKQELRQENGERVIRVADLYSEYAALPLRERREFIERLARTLSTEVPQRLELVRERLRPKVWSLALLDDASLRGPGIGFVGPPRWRLGRHLQAVLVIDGPNRADSVPPETVQAWDVALDVLLDEAEQHMSQTPPNWAVLGRSRAEGGQGRLLSVVGDEFFAASWLLDERSLARLALSDGALASAPSRETLLILEPGDTKLEDLFLRRIQEADAKGARPLCPIPLVRRHGAWETWTPPRDHRQRVAFERLERIYLEEVYAQQTQTLRELGGPEGERFIASHMLREIEATGELISLCAWTQGVPSLLPRTNFIVFVRLGEDAAGKQETSTVRVPWTTVEQHFGKHLRQVAERYPPRYQTVGDPPWERIEALGIDD